MKNPEQKLMVSLIRPAHMRTTHGIGSGGGDYSVSAVMVIEDVLLDHFGTASSGSGMDAPEDLPIGSIKAFFYPPEMRQCFGFCQRTITRSSLCSVRQGRF